jgi:hypothetical protein
MRGSVDPLPHYRNRQNRDRQGAAPWRARDDARQRDPLPHYRNRQNRDWQEAAPWRARDDARQRDPLPHYRDHQNRDRQEAALGSHPHRHAAAHHNRRLAHLIGARVSKRGDFGIPIPPRGSPPTPGLEPRPGRERIVHHPYRPAAAHSHYHSPT